MKWISKYELVTKPEWISISPDGALLMSQVAGNEANYERLWLSVGMAVKRDIERVLPKVCIDEPPGAIMGKCHLPMTDIVPFLHVFAAYKIVPQWRQIGVEYRIMSSFEADVLKKEHPVKLHVELPVERHQQMPVVLPASETLH
jgi:hypothetical protein